MEQILPQIDTKVLQEKANEYAMKGALDALKEYYTGYNSPYKKAIEENLKNKGVDHTIEIPDIIGILNDSISQEVDMIANNAVAKSFVPLVKRFLTRADAEVNFSDILKEFIEYSEYKSDEDLEIDDYSVAEVKNDGSFMYLTISNNKISFELHFYKKSRKDEPEVYELYTLPYVKDNNDKYSSRTFSEKKMKISLDGVSLELPFTPRVLEDEFMSYIATLIIANSQISFDVKDFSDELFPDKDNQCHCDEY